MRTVAVYTAKGGTGKTSTAAALTAGLRRQGMKVLMIDADPQRNLSAMMDANQAPAARTLYDVVTGHSVLRKAVQSTPQGPIVASDSRLAEKGILGGKNTEYRLRAALEPVARDYDVTVVDCGPALTTLTYTALTAADGVIVPCCADRFSLDALRATAATINTVAANSNKRLTVYGVLITQYNRRLTVARLMREQIERQAAALGWKVYDTAIRQCVAVTEATLTGNSVFDAGRNNAASDYSEIIDELLTQMDLQ